MRMRLPGREGSLMVMCGVADYFGGRGGSHRNEFEWSGGPESRCSFARGPYIAELRCKSWLGSAASQRTVRYPGRRTLEILRPKNGDNHHPRDFLRLTSHVPRIRGRWTAIAARVACSSGGVARGSGPARGVGIGTRRKQEVEGGVGGYTQRRLR